MDIKIAFLNSKLEKPVHMHVCQGLYLIKHLFSPEQQKLLQRHYDKLRKCVIRIPIALYGLPESARLWNIDLTQVIKDAEFKQSM
eukprot:Pgem_evm1s18012